VQRDSLRNHNQQKPIAAKDGANSANTSTTFPMKVLIACEESQPVCKTFRALGHEAYSCDIQVCSGGHPEWHIQGDAIEVAYGQHWDLMIAHPPCTHLAVSGAAWFPEKIADGRQQAAVEFFLKLANAPIYQVCVENPICIISSIWKKPTQIINPFQFGDPTPKKTSLWLKNLPKLQPTNVVAPEFIIGKKDGKRYSIIHYQTPGKTPEERSKIRSKTFQGIADAMAQQWGNREQWLAKNDHQLLLFP
jgi:hypothetical protein